MSEKEPLYLNVETTPEPQHQKVLEKIPVETYMIKCKCGAKQIIFQLPNGETWSAFYAFNPGENIQRADEGEYHCNGCAGHPDKGVTGTPVR